MTAKWRKGTGGPSGDECQNLVVDLVQVTSKTNRSKPGEVAPTIATTSNLVVFNGKASASQSMNPGPISPTLDVGKSDGLMVFDMRNGKVDDEVTMTLLAGQPGHGMSANTVPHTASPKGVRRLTPLECERLQGFPDVRKSLYIWAWKNNYIGPQKSYAIVGDPNHRLQKSAFVVDKLRLNKPALSVMENLKVAHPGSDKRVVVNALINLEGNILHINSPEKLKLNVSIAGASKQFPQSIQLDNFAQVVAHIIIIQAHKTQVGKEGKLPKGNFFSMPENGNKFVVKFGQGNVVSAKDADLLIKESVVLMKSTTSQVGQSSRRLDWILTTLLCYVTSAINSFIPDEILGMSSFYLNIETVQSHTNIIYRRRPAKDGPRYEAIGNSMAVPVLHWLGRRIEMVDKIFTS